MAGKRGRGRIFSPSTIRSKKSQRAKERRDKSIFIGDTYHRWTSLKEQHGPCLTDSEWAARLLDVYERRCDESYDVYKTRCQLAAIDYLAHLDRPEKKTADGQNIYHRIYSKITNHWRVFTTKTDKVIHG